MDHLCVCGAIWLCCQRPLGYFIYPICTVLLGVAVLGERLDSWGWLAVCCVTFGVLIKAFFVAGVPWVALSVAVTFSLYAVARKRLKSTQFWVCS